MPRAFMNRTVGLPTSHRLIVQRVHRSSSESHPSLPNPGTYRIVWTRDLEHGGLHSLLLIWQFRATNNAVGNDNYVRKPGSVVFARYDLPLKSSNLCPHSKSEISEGPPLHPQNSQRPIHCLRMKRTPRLVLHATLPSHRSLQTSPSRIRRFGGV